MDVLLINPFSWTRDGRPAYLPYGVLYLAGYLQARRINVEIFDCNTRTDDPIEYIIKTKPNFAGLSVLSGPVIKEALLITDRIKKVSPNTTIIWGGLHPTLFPSHVLQNKQIDFIIQGEGEQALYEIVTGKNMQRCNRFGMGNNFISLDHNFPAFYLLNCEVYVGSRTWAKRVLTMNTSRGCIFKCAFCFNQGLPNQRWRGLSAKGIAEQIIYLRNVHRIDGIQFYEDCFDADKNRVREFCRLIQREKIKWAHFSNITLADEDLLKEEYDAGCRYIEYGVESGSDRILNFINKRQTTEQIREAFNKCKRAKIKAAALFMIGLPTENEDDLKATVHLIDSLPSHIPICTIYRPYPATPLYKWCVDNHGFKEPQTLEEQAEFYSYGKLADEIVNVSNVSTNYLVKLQKRFYRRLIIKEVLLCLAEFNFTRLFYHAKILWKRLLDIKRN